MIWFTRIYEINYDTPTRTFENLPFSKQTDLKLQYSKNHGHTKVRRDYLGRIILQCSSKLGSKKGKV